MRWKSSKDGTHFTVAIVGQLTINVKRAGSLRATALAARSDKVHGGTRRWRRDWGSLSHPDTGPLTEIKPKLTVRPLAIGLSCQLRQRC